MLRLDGLKRKEHVLEMARLMVRADSSKQRLTLLKVLQVCWKLFLLQYINALGWRSLHQYEKLRKYST